MSAGRATLTASFRLAPRCVLSLSWFAQRARDAGGAPCSCCCRRRSTGSCAAPRTDFGETHVDDAALHALVEDVRPLRRWALAALPDRPAHGTAEARPAARATCPGECRHVHPERRPGSCAHRWTSTTAAERGSLASDDSHDSFDENTQAETLSCHGDREQAKRRSRCCAWTRRTVLPCPITCRADLAARATGLMRVPAGPRA